MNAIVNFLRFLRRGRVVIKLREIPILKTLDGTPDLIRGCFELDCIAVIFPGFPLDS